MKSERVNLEISFNEKMTWWDIFKPWGYANMSEAIRHTLRRKYGYDVVGNDIQPSKYGKDMPPLKEGTKVRDEGNPNKTIVCIHFEPCEHEHLKSLVIQEKRRGIASMIIEDMRTALKIIQ